MSKIEQTSKDVPILQVSDLYVAYGSVTALHGVSLEVREGELVSICGINGAGKSTVLKAIAGVLKPKSGHVYFKGEDVTGRNPERLHKLGMALVPEGREIFSTLSVAENLRLGAFGRYSRRAFDETLEDYLQLFPILRERYHQSGGLLSGGEQQMLAIARGLMSNPDLLLLDEPSLGLSPTRVDDVFQLIIELKSRGITILLVEQNAERALAIADRAYLFSTGSVEFDGQAKDLLENVDITSVYLGDKREVTVE